MKSIFRKRKAKGVSVQNKHSYVLEDPSNGFFKEIGCDGLSVWSKDFFDCMFFDSFNDAMKYRFRFKVLGTRVVLIDRSYIRVGVVVK